MHGEKFSETGNFETEERRRIPDIADLSPKNEQQPANQSEQEKVLNMPNLFEAHVAERTAALEAVNAQLRKEIAECEHAQKTIQAEHEFVNTVLESLSHPFYIVDADDYTVKKANPAAISAGIVERSTCYSVTHRGGNPCEGLDHACPLEEVKKTGRPTVVEHLHYDNEGNATHVDVYAYPIFDSEGTVKQVIEYCLDITDRKRAEQLTLRSERLKAIGELASGVAHNFNNLLQIVLGSAQLALANLETGEVSKARKDLERIVDSSLRGSHTVRRLQDFVRIKSRNGAPAGKVFDIAATVRDAIQMSRPFWETKPESQGFSISLVSDLQSGCLIQGREAELFDVVMNLIQNAAEALPKGGEIRISSSVEDGGVLIRIADNGIGISKDDLGRVFEPFQTTKGPQVIGMGLACSLGIVKQHLGDIFVESAEGQGSLFTVKLPFANGPADEEESADKPHVIPALRLLVVDDVEAVATVLGDGLSEFGQTIFTASSGIKAIEIFKSTQVDLVLCDLGMPQINGWQVASAIKSICAEKGVAKTPFVLITGWDRETNEDSMAAQSGVDAIVRKPIDILNLLEVIHEVVWKSSVRDVAAKAQTRAKA
jgi:signal transduction histidine kinase/CheY-like chemotaxis protein